MKIKTTIFLAVVFFLFFTSGCDGGGLESTTELSVPATLTYAPTATVIPSPTKEPTATLEPTKSYCEGVNEIVQGGTDVWKLGVDKEEASEIANECGFEFEYYQNVGPVIIVNDYFFIPVMNRTNVENDINRTFEEIPSGLSFIDNIIVRFEEGLLIFNNGKDEVYEYPSETGEFLFLVPKYSISLFRIIPSD